MTIMSDIWIQREAEYNELITPFISYSESKLPTGKPITSYGLSSYGYDIRLGDHFKLFKSPLVSNTPSLLELKEEQTKAKDNEEWLNNEFVCHYYGRDILTLHTDKTGRRNLTYTSESDFIDPMNFNEDIVVDIDKVDSLVLPPGAFCLGVSMEKIKMPRDVSAICMEKSTLARCGLCVTVTPLEAGWEGYVTLEIHNKTNNGILLTSGMGICQVQFFKGDQPCRVSYSDRNGKYQNQPPEPILPRRKN